MSNGEDCICAYCRDELAFDLDGFLLDEIAAGNVVVFAGAGVSTENRLSAPHSLYAELADGLGFTSAELPFPDLAKEYASKPDGRFHLIQRIQERFDYINKFSDLRHQSQKIHREISTMPYLREFVTTNWDRHFETVCNAKPFVYDEDMRFWNVPFRKVLKIHGTIDDYSSIIATRDDYVECAERLHKSLVGSKLKEILSTKTCIFVGYSMNDDDFKEIFAFVSSAQGKFEKVHFFVSPYASSESPFKNVLPIRTDGTYFFRVIKDHMCQTHCYIEDDIYDEVLNECIDIEKEHREYWNELDAKEEPQGIMSGIYQDGLIHGYELILDMKGSGMFSDLHIVQGKVNAYEDKIRDHRSRRSYIDVAYFSGFQNALLSLALFNRGDFVNPPRYFYPGIGEMDKEEHNERFCLLPTVHKGAFRQCQQAVKNWPVGERFVIQHPPWG